MEEHSITETEVYHVYSKGRVNGSASASQIGGLFGSSEITTGSSFWNVDLSSLLISASSATVLTDAQMKPETTLTSTVWEIVGDNYPQLKSNANKLVVNIFKNGGVYESKITKFKAAGK
ncbi:MAG: hypothetical protein ACOYU5_02280 [Stygiobacter sp.]